ncbi:MAG: PAS domain S-box protein, partial [Candidatus Cloacimonadales bacterium]
DPVKKVISSGEVVGLANHTVLISQNGKEYQIADSAAPIKNAKGEILGVVLVFSDVTEKYTIQKKIAESEERFQKMLSVVPDLISIHDTEMNILYSNWKGWGAVPPEKRKANTKCYNTYRGFDEICPDCKLQKVLASKEPFIHEIELPDKTWVELRIIPIIDNNGKIGSIMEWVRDITQQKHLEIDLKQSEEKFRTLANSAKVMISIVADAQGSKYLYVNEEWQRVLGYSREEAQKMRPIDLIAPEQRQEVLDYAAKRAAGKQAAASYELKIITKTGETKYLDFSSTLINFGSQRAFLTTSIDITERQQAKKLLQESEHTFRKLFEDSADPILLIDENGRFAECNQATLDLLKMSKKQFISQRPIDISPQFQPDGSLSKTAAPKMMKLAYAKGLHRFDWTHLKADGTEFIAGISLMPIVVKGKTMLHTTWRVITERKRIEHELAEKTSFLSTIMETSPVGIVTVDKTGVITYANQRATEILGLVKEEITSITYDAPLWQHTDLDGSALPDEKQPFNIVKKTLKTAMDIQHGITWPDGTVVILSINATPIFDDNHKFNGMLASIEDITQRKQSEADIKQLLQEKEILLKEVHHRVKNNISVVQSMLSLQALSIENDKCKTALREAAARLQSMLALYNKLYRSEIKRNQSLQIFLPPLIKEIIDNFEEITTIQPELQLADIILDPKILVPLGIILNECITNSVKYAFTQSETGKISIKASQNNDRVKITYADGSAMVDPEQFARSETFGLKLIQLMIKQIAGTIRIEQNDKTEYVIEFRI